MRLINTKSLKLETFAPSKIPPYAILSHTWGKEEISFQEFHDLEKTRTKRGFSKIDMTCKLARDKYIEYAWVDTCCIDKTSSAELSESLNSMFSWYQSSHICYTYISDWLPDTDWSGLTPLEQDEGSIERDEDSSNEGEGLDAKWDEHSDEEYVDIENGFEESYLELWQNDERMNQGVSSNADLDRDAILQLLQPDSSSIDENPKESPLRWFTRGWTLQELIAPCEMEFYDANWTLRGTKSDPVIIEHLSRITGIPQDVLGEDGKRALQRVCLGQRMSWAAHRETSREEDLAYCLLGIFQVNMPMLYGEGERAFIRLQEEILKYSTDLSIFAWTQHHEDQHTQQYRGILSRHPREFYRLKDCRLVDTQFRHTEEFVMTNRGLRFNISLLHPAFEATISDSVDINFMDLACLIHGEPQGIFFQRMSDFYVRVFPNSWIQTSDFMRRSESRTIYIARDVDRDTEHKYITDLAFGVKIQISTRLNIHSLQIIDAWPPAFFDRIQSTFLASELDEFVGFAKFTISDHSLPINERNGIADFILVVVFNLKSFAGYLVDGEHAAEFETFAKSTWSMAHTTAESELRKYLSAASKHFKSEIVFTDSSTRRPYRVTAKMRTKQWQVIGTVVPRKAIRIEFSRE